ncbi:hypothetical protein [Cryptosporangium minutisporangium]|uniref:Uncharacterized protein n=1 Tax=Cryptosporangium minutisporangium TaxID=113569 RepID=A0ABP6SV10_9ACTN
MPTLTTDEDSGSQTDSPDELRSRMVSALVEWRAEVGSRLAAAVEAAVITRW